jgi:hypothetical protein
MTIFNPVQAVRVNLSHEVPCRFLPPDYADGIEVPRLSLTGESYRILLYIKTPAHRNHIITRNSTRNP